MDARRAGGGAALRALLLCSEDPDHALAIDYLAAGLERDGIEVERCIATSDGNGTVDILAGTTRDIEVAVTLLDERTLDVGTGRLRSARRRWSRCGLIGVSNVPDLRLLGPRWEERPTGARFIALPALSSADEFSAHVRAAAAQPFAEVPPVDLPLPLTAAQVALLGLVAAGFTNAEIAAQRHSTEKAVRNMIGRIAKRLAIDEDAATNVRAALVRYLLVDHSRQADRKATDDAEGSMAG